MENIKRKLIDAKKLSYQIVLIVVVNVAGFKKLVFGTHELGNGHQRNGNYSISQASLRH